MKTIASLITTMFVVTTTLFAQNSFDPLVDLGISFGDPLPLVLGTLQRAGLTVERVDSGRGLRPGKFFITATGLTFHGHPATVRLGGSTEEGVRSVHVAVPDSVQGASLEMLRQQCLSALTRAHGEARHDTGGRCAPKSLMAFRDEYAWIVDRSDDRSRVRVLLSSNAGAGVPAIGGVGLGLTYADIDRFD